MNPYTIVGLWLDTQPPLRVAAHVMAEDPDKAEEWFRREYDAGKDTDFLLAGVFAGHLMALDKP